MSDFKGTPGPWRAVSQSYSNGQTGDRGTHWWVEHGDGLALPMSSGRNMVPFEVAEANARLIAAAPELLAALIEMVGQFNFVYRGEEDARILDMAVAAIDKAMGI